jgi:mycobactin lysine-N-oxygenase
MSVKHMTIVGAGPKAIAIAAKAYVLSELGFKVPKISILEHQKVGANWLPETGFTNGRVVLGDTVENDLGFPYDSLPWDEKLNSRVNYLMQRFSWQSHLISKGKYASWIDRGRPVPDHYNWASYLEWALNQVLEAFPAVSLHFTEFQNFDLSENETWIVTTKDRNNIISSFETDGIVMTGPGEIRRLEQCPSHPRILDTKTFWENIGDFEKLTEPSKIAIIGNGESAATAAVVLGEISRSIETIDLVTCTATHFSRGESYTELFMYSNPIKGGWLELTLQDRLDFLQRTDRGVFSLTSKQKLDQMENVHTINGWVHGVQIDPSNKIGLEIEYNKRRKTCLYDYVIFAMGFDHLKFVTLKTSEETRQKIVQRSKIPEWDTASVEQSIVNDLSLNNLEPKLHLPMLSALQQGPGFPCLGCLGHLSDRILSSWVVPA